MLDTILHFLDTYFIIPVTLTSILVTLITGLVGARLRARRERRERENLSIERRRLSEVNIGMTPRLRVRHESNRAFVTLHLPFRNLGDGPVDMLGVLVSAKTMTSPDAGTGSRDVGWADYGQLGWNYPGHDADAPLALTGKLLRGISTTRLLTVSADQYPRLAVNENMELLRTEVVINRDAQPVSENTFLMHRIFLVARGYTLGEILSQLGGHPRDPLRTVRPQLLQFQPLAQPNYFRWSQVQKALFNINRFGFRLATGESDPLGRLCSPDAWRLFLLHHWDFVDDADVAPAGCKHRYDPLDVTTTEVKQEVITRWYHDQVLPYDWHLTPEGKATYEEARRYCREKLSELVNRWERLMKLIEQAKDYRPNRDDGDGNLTRGKTSAAQKFDIPIVDIPDEWYPRLIHRQDETGQEHRDRWFALMKEGYLITRPLPQHMRSWKRGINRYTYADIPPDPRILEPFVMRTRFFLAEIRLEMLGDPARQVGVAVSATERPFGGGFTDP